MALPQSVAGFTKHGKFYTVTAPTRASDVKSLVKAIVKAFAGGEPKQLIWILSGTHGTADGDLVRERRFFWDEDKTLDLQYLKAVDVFHFTAADGTIAKNSWERYTAARAIVILAWCYSEQSRNGWMAQAGLRGIDG